MWIRREQGERKSNSEKNQNPKLNNKTQNSKERKKNQNHFYLYEKQIAVCLENEILRVALKCCCFMKFSVDQRDRTKLLASLNECWNVCFAMVSGMWMPSLLAELAGAPRREGRALLRPRGPVGSRCRTASVRMLFTRHLIRECWFRAKVFVAVCFADGQFLWEGRAPWRLHARLCCYLLMLS